MYNGIFFPTYYEYIYNTKGNKAHTLPFIVNADAHLAHLFFCRHTKPTRKKPKELNFAKRTKRNIFAEN